MPDHPLPVARSIRDLRKTVARWRQEGAVVGLVPTMGALHEGHLSLVRALLARNARVVTSVFVNPTQFAAHEDLDQYPRTEAADAALLAKTGCHLMYAPTTEAMYPPGHATAVSVSGVSGHLEGAVRPHFFDGVATIVTKLLLQCLPDVAIFGEKDFQQLMVIRRLVKDLDLPVEIAAGETVREPDGLAMSSRNVYLTPEERAIAPAFHTLLREASRALEAGGSVNQTMVRLERSLFKAGFSEIDYVSLRGAEDFLPIASPIVTRSARLLGAVRIGAVRLLDNVPVTAGKA